MSINEYIKELKQEFKKYKIEKSTNYSSWFGNNRVSITYHYRLCKNGKIIHHFEFCEPKTKIELEQAYIQAYIKAMTSDMPF